jgi:hypothetical protein
MALCAFAISVLGMIAHFLNVSHHAETMISRVTLVIGGMWLAIYIIMIAFGHLTFKKRPINREAVRTHF